MTALALSPDKVDRNLVEAFAIATTFTTISYLIGFFLGFTTGVNWLEAFAVFTSYGSTYLFVVQRRMCYVWGMISTAAYALLFWQFGLLASMVLNLYLVPTLVYGWFRWGRDEVTRPIKRLPLKLYPVYILVTAAVFAGAYFLMAALGAPILWTDGMILVLTILAQFLLDNKRPETWAVWAMVNVFAIYTYFTGGLFLAGVQYILFLINTGYGAYMWYKDSK